MLTLGKVHFGALVLDPATGGALACPAAGGLVDRLSLRALRRFPAGVYGAVLCSYACCAVALFAWRGDPSRTPASLTLVFAVMKAALGR